MDEKQLHDQLIRELLEGKSLSPRENAARNEIIALRKRLEEMDKPVRKSKVTKEE